MKILISTSSFGVYDKTPLTLLKEKGFEVITNPYNRKLSENEISELLVDVDGLIAGTEPLTEKVLTSANKLKVISRCGTGMDNVNSDAAARLGIKVLNTPDAPTLAVAELAVGSILSLLRKISWMDRDIRAGNWKKRMGNLLYGKKVGIIGFGRIGKKTAELLTAFGVEIAYCDLSPQSCSIHCSNKDGDEILKWADIITLHLSPSKDCRHIIGEKELGMMNKGSLLINLSRGGLVDEAALYHSLKEGHLAGAALDVYEKEPYSGNLKELENVILLPHIGSYAVESRINMEIESLQNLLKGFDACP
ncbi:MAG: phosphoglycerate dehydrogenase [Nitrospirota bacterium]|nr:phosphoglycerate dehydrogenase [Nitrospirota bacterium]